MIHISIFSLSDGVSVYDHFTPKKDNFRYIGKKSARIDNVNKLKDPSFGIDSAPLGALNCSVLHKPRGCDEYNINNSADIEKLFGVRGVLKFDFGIAIVAEKFWQVKNAMDLLDITWKRETHDSTLRINQISSNETPSSDSQQIESSKSLGQTSHRCTYSVPYLAHACMEPINGCALLTHESCELWIPTQAPILAQAVTAQITGLEFEQIRVNCAFCGGGFGRRLYQDFVEEVVRVAQQFPGIPIQMIWTREEDMRNDFYRPESTAQLEGLVSSSGELISWSHTNFTAPFSADVFKRFSHGIFPEWLGHTLRNKLGHGIGHLMSGIFAKEGANKIPYKCENFDYQWKETEAELPLGFWRSVGHSINGFFKESFIDELSYFTKLNPIDFRLKNIPEEDFRHKTVLVKLSQHKLWSSRNNNKGVGVAIHESYDTVVGQLVKVSEKNNNIEIDYIYIVVDCGHIVDPDGVKSQMEGGVVFGLSAALWGEITVQNHDVEQSNFHDYQCMRMDTCPDIDVDILDSISEKVGGCGEAGVPPIAAAVANAIYHLNGKRLRSLPLLKHY